jgi:hypothetical protein
MCIGRFASVFATVKMNVDLRVEAGFEMKYEVKLPEVKFPILTMQYLFSIMCVPVFGSCVRRMSTP